MAYGEKSTVPVQCVYIFNFSFYFHSIFFPFVLLLSAFFPILIFLLDFCFGRQQDSQYGEGPEQRRRPPSAPKNLSEITFAPAISGFGWLLVCLRNKCSPINLIFWENEERIPLNQPRPLPSKTSCKQVSWSLSHLLRPYVQTWANCDSWIAWIISVA